MEDHATALPANHGRSFRTQRRPRLEDRRTPREQITEVTGEIS